RSGWRPLFAPASSRSPVQVPAASLNNQPSPRVPSPTTAAASPMAVADDAEVAAAGGSPTGGDAPPAPVGTTTITATGTVVTTVVLGPGDRSQLSRPARASPVDA